MSAPTGGPALAGAVALDVYPDSAQFYTRLRAQVLPGADSLGREIGERIGAPIAAHASNGVTDGLRRGRAGASAQGTRTGEDIGAALARALKGRLESALRSLPEAHIDADSSALERKIANVRRQLLELSSKRVGIDVTDDEAIARVQLLRQQLSALARDVEKVREAGGDIPLNLDAFAAGAEITRLGQEMKQFKREAESPTRIKVELGEFETELRNRVRRAAAALPDITLHANSTDVEHSLARIKAELITLRDQRIGVDIDTAAAVAKAAELQAQLKVLGSTSPNIAVKVDAAAAATQLAAIAAAAAGVGALDPKVKVKVDTTGAIAQIGAMISMAVLGKIALASLAGAGGVLALTIVPAAAAAVAAIGAIGPAALAALGGIGVLVLALSGVIGAVGALNKAQDKGGQSATSYASKQNSILSALDGVKSAEQQLANAQQQAVRDQQALTAARQAARQAMEDLTLAVADGALSQRAANLDLAESQQHLDEVMKNPLSTLLERQRAQLAVDQAKQRIIDLGVQQARIEAQQKQATRAGVEGSPQVISAKDTIVRDQQSIEAATRSLAAAQRSLAQAYASAAAAGAGGANAVTTAMEHLSPAGREFARFIVSLKPEFYALRQAAETGLLPGLEAGIKSLLPVMPQIILFVGSLARVMGSLFAQAGKALASPFWATFFGQVARIAGPLLEALASTVGGLARGFASLLLAFAPISLIMVRGLAGLAQGFAAWAAQLPKSKGFQTFLDYVKVNGPKVMTLLGGILAVAIKLLEGLAPFAAVVLDIAAAFFTWLDKLDPSQLLLIAGAIGAVVLAFAIASGGVLAFAIGIGLVVAAVVGAYMHFTGFRKVVDVTFHAIAVAAIWLWQNVLKPTFTAVYGFIANQLIPAVLWLYRNAFKPAFEAIAAVVAFAWNSVIHPLLDAARGFLLNTIIPVVLFLWHNVWEPAFLAIAAVVAFVWSNIIRPALSGLRFVIEHFVIPIVLFLYQNVFRPAFAAIGVVVQVAWAILQVIFGLIQIAIKVVAVIVLWLWKTIFEPAFAAIGAVVKLVWENVLKPIFSALGDFIEKHVAPGFQRGVAAISRAWAGIRDAARAPVLFVLDTVLNHGILAGYNWIAKKFGIKPDNVQIPLPAGLTGGTSSGSQQVDHGAAAAIAGGFAGGGFVTGSGTATSDSILARLSNGEYVIPARTVAALGVDFFDALIGKGGIGGPRQPGDGSQGLAITPGFAGGGFVDTLASIWHTITDPVGWLASKAAGLLSKIPGGDWVKSVIGGVGHKVIDGIATFVRSLITDAVSADGKWIGPVSASTVAVQRWISSQAGKPYVWDAAGPDGYDCSGLVSAAWNLLHNRSPFVHTFSTADEAGFFPLPGFGPFTAGWAGAGQRGGGDVGHTAGNLAGLAFESRGGDGVVVGAGATGVTGFANVGHYDAGGFLPPGITIAHNNTGAPEPVLTGAQWDALTRQQPAPNVSYTYQVHPVTSNLDAVQLQGLVTRQDTLARIGRPR